MKRSRKGVRGKEMRVKDWDGNMLMEGNAVWHRWADNFDELQASIGAVGGDNRMHVFQDN